jgi:uncharacterized protein YceK
MKHTLVFLISISLIASGCATIFSGSNTGMRMESSPDGASVWVNGANAGTTPCKIELKKNQEYSIEVRKEGYQTRTTRITNSVGAGWIVLDVVFGLVPVIVDAATGSWCGLSQDNINVVLEKQQK